MGFRFGVHYADFWGHRGFTHSLFFAALLAALIVFGVFRQGVPGLSPPKLWFFLFLATASHGVLDAMTNGGLGVAFFSPFDNGRYFFALASDCCSANLHSALLRGAWSRSYEIGTALGLVAGDPAGNSCLGLLAAQ